ncbi:MAG: DUF5683 domain-containing protein [Bacteroidota bacterium]
MRKSAFYIAFFLIFCQFTVNGQRINTDDVRFAGDSLVMGETIDPLSPARATFYSAILPGLGQAYNKKYWKIPIIYAALGTGVYFYEENLHQLDRYKTAYKQRIAGFPDEFNGLDGNPLVSEDGLLRAQDVYRKNRDLSIFITLGLYALNIIEANVDAHLDDRVFNKNLSLNPSLNIHPVENSAVAGINLKFDF